MTLVAVGGVLVTAAAFAVRAVVGLRPGVEAEHASGEDVDARVRSASRPSSLTRGDDRPREIAAPPQFEPAPAPVTPEAPPNPVAADAASPPAAVGASPAPPSNAAIQAALRQTRIVMFATSWCSVCTRARSFLDANGLTREERDVDRDERARAELERLTGKASVPVFLVDGELVSGFSEKSMTRVLVASVEKRLGLKGIRVRTAEGR